MTSSLWISQPAINKLLRAHYQADLGAHQTDSSWIAQSVLYAQRLCWNFIQGAVCPLWFTVERWAELLCCLLFVCFFPETQIPENGEKKKKVGIPFLAQAFAILWIFAPCGVAVLPCPHRCVWDKILAICVLRTAMQHWGAPDGPSYSSIYSLSACRRDQTRLHKTCFSITGSQTQDSTDLSTWQWQSFARAAGHGW